MMTTADIALITDSNYKKISEDFHKNPEKFSDAFARAWFKLLHRDMGPKVRYLGPEVPKENLIWQDPIPQGNSNYDVDLIKNEIKQKNLSAQDMIETAWASASTFRISDMRGGANGARIRLEPQKNWEANKPEQLARVLDILEPISSKNDISLADTIVLAGNVGLEKITNLDVPFSPGRGDASQEETDIESFEVLEPNADGFRNFQKGEYTVSPEEMMLDKAHLLGLTAPEMVVLYGGLRSIGISEDEKGLWTETDELSNEWFKVLLGMDVVWSEKSFNHYEGSDRKTGKILRKASRCDLIFGSNSELRSLSELYSQDDNNEKFVKDFIKAWVKVMNSDRFDLLS